MERQRLSEQLVRLPVEELVAVLREVFAARVPFPEEAASCRTRFYLGTAYSDLLTEPGHADEWGPWKTDAVVLC